MNLHVFLPVKVKNTTRLCIVTFTVQGLHQSNFDFSPLAEIARLLQMLLKFDHVFTLVDVRLHFLTPFTAIHVETGYRNTIGHVKVARYG